MQSKIFWLLSITTIFYGDPVKKIVQSVTFSNNNFYLCLDYSISNTNEYVLLVAIWKHH